MADDSIDTRPPTALPATLAAAVPRLAESLALLDDAHHLVISVKGSKRYVQFAAFGPNLRGESVGNTCLRGPAQLGVGDLLWLADHGWHDPDEGGNHWRHWEPADHLAAATVALVTLHVVHGVDHVGQLVFQSEDPRVIDAFAGGWA